MIPSTKHTTSLEEGRAISLYKEYHLNKLPITETIDGLWLQDFDEEAYPDLDTISALQCYLDNAKTYTATLSRAAELRELHYQEFIRPYENDGSVTEDPKHSYWRLAMNAVAIAARVSLLKWQNIHATLLDKLITEQEKRSLQKELQAMRQVSPPVKLSTRNVDFDPTRKSTSETVNRPTISEAEKRRRKNIRKKEKIAENQAFLAAKALKEAEINADLSQFEQEHKNAESISREPEILKAADILARVCLLPTKHLWSSSVVWERVFPKRSPIVGTGSEFSSIVRAYLEIFSRYDSDEEFKIKRDEMLINRCDWRILTGSTTISRWFIQHAIQSHLAGKINLLNLGSTAKSFVKHALNWAAIRFNPKDLLTLLNTILENPTKKDRAKRKIIRTFMISIYLDGWCEESILDFRRIYVGITEGTPNRAAFRRAQLGVYINSNHSAFVEPEGLNYVRVLYKAYSINTEKYHEWRRKALSLR